MSRADLRLALDLGTTTLGGGLYSAAGELLGEGRRPNPQAELGADIVRRLEAARRGEGPRLQRLLLEGMEELVGELLRAAGVTSAAVTAAAAAGNPGICHLLRGLPVDSLLFPPHRPVEGAGVPLPPDAPAVGLTVPLYLFPLVSGYVGGDLVAFLFGQPREPDTFYLDIGTNGEMAWFDGRRWWTTSVAAGPAFEGGEISCGMALDAGAVTDVRVEGDRFRLAVHGGGPPRGLSGSGLAAAIAAALKAGLIDRMGTIAAPPDVPTNLARVIIEEQGGRALRLYRDAAVDLRLTQQDVRSFQLAKGALHAGAACLLHRAGAGPAAVRSVVVTGAFGLSMAPETLKRVAMLPNGMVDRVRFTPGGALSGVGRMLASSGGREAVEALAGSLAPYPLSGTPAFEKAFLAAMDFQQGRAEG